MNLPPSKRAPTPGAALIQTADDTERRLLGELPAPLVVLVCSGDWTIGCEFAPGEEVTSVGWAMPTNSAVQSDNPKMVGTAHPRRPAIVPKSAPLPEWMASTFHSWRSAANVRSSIELTALEAGLRQIHGDLDGSHQCAQSIEGAGRHNGDYWHAIMHRREPDYGNSKYWFRRVGRHPIFPALAKEAAVIAEQFRSETLMPWLPKLLAGGAWDPMMFVDCTEAAAGTNDNVFRGAVEEIQYREMLLLFAQTCRDCV